MSDSPMVPPPVPFKDRRTGLIVFGVLLILLGCLCALLVPLMVFGQVVSAQTLGTEPNYRMIIPGVLMYGLLAVLFIVLGGGSIKTRRWARALMLIFSWVWLVSGIIGFGFMAILMPKILSASMSSTPGAPAGMVQVIMGITMVILAVIYLILPLAFVLFYRSPHVKATCEARDPVERWTDRRPLPVLGTSVMLGFGALGMLLMPVVYNTVMPFFGTLVTGWLGVLIWLIFFALWSVCAWGIYQLKPAAWWLTVIALIVMGLSSTLTFARVDLMEMYRLMGYSAQQLEQMQKMNVLQNSTFVWMMPACLLPWLGFLVYLKKFFRPTA